MNNLHSFSNSYISELCSYFSGEIKVTLVLLQTYPT